MEKHMKKVAIVALVLSLFSLPAFADGGEEEEKEYSPTGPFVAFSKAWGSSTQVPSTENRFSLFGGVRTGQFFALEFGGARQSGADATGQHAVLHTTSMGVRFILPLWEEESGGLDVYFRPLFGKYNLRQARDLVAVTNSGRAIDYRFGISVRTKKVDMVPGGLNFGVEVGSTQYSGAMSGESGAKTASMFIGLGF